MTNTPHMNGANPLKIAFTLLSLICLWGIIISAFATPAFAKARKAPAAVRSVSEDSSEEIEAELTSTRKEPSDLKQVIRSLRAKDAQLEESLDRLSTELDIMREQTRLLVQRTNVGFRDLFYLRLGASILIPRAQTFGFTTETGLGVFMGVGKYFGKQHVVEVTLDWDLYPAATLRYHYEFQSSLPSFVWGPVIGIKGRIVKAGPLDTSFLAEPENVKSTFWCVGALVGFPIARSLVSAEFLYLSNKQSLFTTNLSFHVYW